MPKSRKSIDPGSGILFFNWIIFSILISWYAAARPLSPGDSVTNTLTNREYELQFMNADLAGRIDHEALAQIGIGKVIVRSFKNDASDGGLYFRNSFFNVLQPYLERLGPEFSSRHSGLHLWAWMIGRKFNWEEETKYFDYEFAAGAGGQGDRRIVRKYDLFNPDAVDRIVGVYKELAAKNIQGILIQDDLFIRYNEGFSNWGKAKFTLITHLPLSINLAMRSHTAYSQNWNRIKINQVNHVLSRIVGACKAVNPEIRVGMNIYYETPLYVRRAEKWYAHNLKEIVKTGIDHIYLMTYHRQMKEEMKFDEVRNRQVFQLVVNRASEVCGDKLVVKLQIKDWHTGRRIPLTELREYLRLIPPAVKRICFTPLTPADLDYIKQVVDGEKSHGSSVK